MAFKAPGGNFKGKCNPAKGCVRVPQIIKNINTAPGVPPPPPPPPTPSVTPTPIPPSPSATRWASTWPPTPTVPNGTWKSSRNGPAPTSARNCRANW